MAKEGADVGIADLKIDPAMKVADEVKALGRKAIALKTDVTKEDDFVSLFAQVRKELGKIDILVNNAGVPSRPGNPCNPARKCCPWPNGSSYTKFQLMRWWGMLASRW
jgi:NAD(P)-dependent dehydrogenase (short-subunit alcohol dehydrogenase family)